MYLSHFIGASTPTFGNKGGLSISKSRSMCDGCSTNEMRIDMLNHIGTHVDAPYHFDEQGKKLTDYSADFWVCRNILLIDLQGIAHNQLIDLALWQTLAPPIDEGTDLLLIRTGFEKYRANQSDESPYIFKGPGLHPDLCEYFRKTTTIRMLGFDFISLTAFAHREPGRIAHRMLLGPLDRDAIPFTREPILIIEDMSLRHLEGSPKMVVIAPLMIENADGGPVTAFVYSH
ncbi:MAG TPA: cyclase family protein [Oligoflexus sp.]|uniref:cyclase family protein n=1 Tax=Oligoflexus sp. TaxID=1971216 RepID=UPI002D283083|nr:cyclase family protein [Oligoflexus sp.]HYX35376.1 cyclase family protein [Oligoflexus sp.]